jgi:hypothetical protein
VNSRKDQEQYWCTNSGKPYRYVSAKEFAEAFKSFHVGADLISELSIPCDKTKCHPAALFKEKYGLSKTRLFKACFDRQLLLMKRNAFIHIFKFLQVKTNSHRIRIILAIEFECITIISSGSLSQGIFEVY